MLISSKYKGMNELQMLARGCDTNSKLSQNFASPSIN